MNVWGRRAPGSSFAGTPIFHVPFGMTLPKSSILEAWACRRMTTFTPWIHHMETGSPHARYAILDHEPAGGWRVSLIALEYDWRSAADDARRAGRPDWAHALETGYALR